MDNRILMAAIGLFSLLFVGGSYIVLKTPAEPQSRVLSYAAEDKEKPIAEVKNTFKDLGKIKVSDTQEVIFTLKNIGTKSLQLSDIKSSCGCTAGQIIYQGKTSKEYSMHTKSADIFEIAPQTEAQVKMIYRPFTMPVYGLVEREVYMTTNDPGQPKISFRVKAIVN